MIDWPSVRPDGDQRPLVQALKKFCEVAVARLGCGGFERAAQRGGDSGMRIGRVHADDSAVHHVHIR